MSTNPTPKNYKPAQNNNKPHVFAKTKSACPGTHMQTHFAGVRRRAVYTLILFDRPSKNDHKPTVFENAFANESMYMHRNENAFATGHMYMLTRDGCPPPMVVPDPAPPPRFPPHAV